MTDEMLQEMRDDIKSIKRLLEAALGIQASSVQQLGVVDRPVAVRKLSISKNDDVMFEEEVDGRWGNSQIKNICGRLSGITTRLTEEGGRYGQVLYGYLEIGADVVYSIRFNTEKNFARLLISAILTASYEQLSGTLTLAVEPGTDWKSTRLPSLIDSFGFKIIGSAIQKDDWMQNRVSYLDQAARKIKAARSNTSALGMGNNAQAIAPSSTMSNTIDIPAWEPTEEEALQQKIIASAKELWGRDEFKVKGVEYSAKYFNGVSLKNMAIADLEKYLQGLQGLIQAQNQV